MDLETKVEELIEELVQDAAEEAFREADDMDSYEEGAPVFDFGNDAADSVREEAGGWLVEKLEEEWPKIRAEAIKRAVEDIKDYYE